MFFTVRGRQTRRKFDIFGGDNQSLQIHTGKKEFTRNPNKKHPASYLTSFMKINSFDFVVKKLLDFIPGLDISREKC